MQALVFLIAALLVAAPALAQDSAAVSRGEYLARMGDCTSCHTEPGKPLYAGGFKVNSPFGPIYGTNITPDPTYGIGTYTLEDFTRALRQGIAKDGHRLYPAMPYTDFAKASDDDIAALYDYFMHEVKPVSSQPPATKLPFPFNQRWAIRFWDWAYSPDTRFLPHADKDAAWNRGAYLVQSFGHCGACHTPRGPAYEERGVDERSPHFLHGMTLDHWYAPDLAGDPATGLGAWSEDDIAGFLKNGYGPGAVAFGDMALVVENSTQYINADDRAAIAHYIKSLQQEGETGDYRPDAPPEHFERPDAGIYASACSGCHRADGSGYLPHYPALAGNAAIMAEDPTSVIRIVLEGATTPRTKNGFRPVKMPAFAKMNDREIADIVTYIRQNWGNKASTVTEAQVQKLRKQLTAQGPDTATPGAPPPASPAPTSSPPAPTE